MGQPSQRLEGKGGPSVLEGKGGPYGVQPLGAKSRRRSGEWIMKGKWRKSNIHQRELRNQCGLCLLINTEENSKAISFFIILFILLCTMFIGNTLLLSIMVSYWGKGVESFAPLPNL